MRLLTTQNSSMKFPSISNILHETQTVIWRYPMELFAAGTGTFAAVQLSFNNTDEYEYWLVRILMTAALGLPAFLAVTLRGRFRQYSKGRIAIEYAVVLGLLLAFFFTTHHPPIEKDYIRFALLAIAAHLLVACAGFLGRGTTAAFWQFNKHLFLRIITAGIFSLVLYGGLAGALAALEALFDIKIEGQLYGRLGIWIMGLFNTVFFLARVPANAAALEEEAAYPKVLKVFTQFVLVPLVIIYLAILLAYEAKIMIRWQLPNGWVSNLIIAYGIAGILSLLLVFPIRSMEGNRWIKLFSRWFYLLLLPLVVLMFVAIGVRISSYGFTEDRVFVLALAIWLGGISLYYLFRPNGDIRIIPASLAGIALMLSTGPLSAFAISGRSQRARLGQLLEKHNMLDNGRAVKPPATLSFSERKALSSTTKYLLEHHGSESLYPWFSTDSLKKSRWSSYENAEYLMKAVGVEFVSDYQSEADPVLDSDPRFPSEYRYSAPDGGISIAGYDTYIDDSPIKEYRDSGVYTRRDSFNTFVIYRGREPISPGIYPRKTLKELVNKYGYEADNRNMSPTDMQVSLQGKGCKLLVCYRYLNAYGLSIDDNINYDCVVFIKWE
jgi:hypothetical protein